jgi:hypothetical protein
MLSTLLGSKSAERVLLFLLVNECCYANEIQKIYATPLTPLQSILSKLEKAAVISIEQRGKTKLYRFNPGYPLLDELKALLKKAFILLPHEEKRILFARKEERQLTIKASYAKEKQKALFLTSFWERLSKNQTGFHPNPFRASGLRRSLRRKSPANPDLHRKRPVDCRGPRARFQQRTPLDDRPFSPDDRS